MTAADAPFSDTLAWLAGWYGAACNGDWEHDFGIRIDTLDNPGWSVTISLTGTALEHRPFETVSAGDVGGDGSPGLRWHHCQVADQAFRAACGVFDLGIVLGLFRAWAEAHRT